MKFYFCSIFFLWGYFSLAQDISNLISVSDMQAKHYQKVSFKVMIPQANGDSEMKEIGQYTLQEGKLVPETTVAAAPEMQKLSRIVLEKIAMNPEDLFCPVCHKDVGYAEQRMNQDSSVATYSHEVMDASSCSGHKYEIRYTFVSKQLVKKIMVKSIFTGLKTEYCGLRPYEFFKKVKDGESYLMEYWNGEDAVSVCEQVDFQYQKFRFFYNEKGDYKRAQIINNEQITNLTKSTDVSDYNDLGYEWQYDEEGMLVAIQAKADEDNLNILYLIEYE